MTETDVLAEATATYQPKIGGIHPHGTCIRTVATAARALALSLDVSIIGVNHCVAHLEIGRWQCGIDDPSPVPKN